MKRSCTRIAKKGSKTKDKSEKDLKSFMWNPVWCALPQLEVVTVPPQPCSIMKRCCLPTELSHLISILTLPTENWKGIIPHSVCLPYILHNQPRHAWINLCTHCAQVQNVCFTVHFSFCCNKDPWLTFFVYCTSLIWLWHITVFTTLVPHMFMYTAHLPISEWVSCGAFINANEQQPTAKKKKVLRERWARCFVQFYQVQTFLTCKYILTF